MSASSREDFLKEVTFEIGLQGEEIFRRTGMGYIQKEITQMHVLK